MQATEIVEKYLEPALSFLARAFAAAAAAFTCQSQIRIEKYRILE
jgi:hypothetical protein